MFCPYILLKLIIKPLLAAWLSNTPQFTNMMSEIVLIETALPSAILVSVFAKQYNCSYYYFVFNDGIYIKDAFNLKTIKIIKQNINHKTNKHQFFNNIQESYSSISFSFQNDSFDEYYKDITK